MNFQRLWSIVRKEIITILRDRRTLGTMISLPIIQLVLYGYLSNEVLHQPTIVWDQSNTAESRALVRAFENTR
ncbi:MAG TPA: ABC transporter permease, partial [bacterium]|nr:ABC transporter permease [bacterium]